VSPAAWCPARAAAEELAVTATSARMPSTSKRLVSLLKTFETTMTS